MAQKNKLKKPNHSLIASYLSGLANTALAVLTIFICFFGFKQLNELTKNSQEKFAFDFNKEFYSENNRKLIMLIDMDCLKFNKEDPKFPVFMADNRAQKYLAVCSETNNAKQTKILYSSYEIDMLMGLFDQINHFEENDMMSLETIYSDFGWKIVTIWEYPAIKEYVSWIKDRYKKNLYEGYEKLYIKIKKYEMQKKQATLKN
jgi:hypothetical protein